MKSAGGGIYIPSLDGLRCVAILPVFFSHVLKAAREPNFIPGNFGVTLFFFLSGYLITTLLRLELERTGGVNFKLFYLRRALRIFPTCYLVLALAALYGWYSATMDPWWLLGQVLHLTNYQIIVGGWTAPIAPNTDVYWSLAVEEHFYLLFPMLFVLLARLEGRGRRAALLLAACAIVFLWRCWLVFGLNAPEDRTYLATDTRIDSILFGCVLAVWGNPALDPTRISEGTWKRVLFPLSVVGILLTFLAGERAFRETFAYTIHGLCLFSIFITAVRYPGWGPMRLLNLPGVRWIGALSYAIYLVHPSILFLSRELVGNSLALLLPMATALSVFASAALYHGIELPASRLRKRLSVVQRSRPATEPAARLGAEEPASELR
jgi:peptidoglycan/LPS O-acetylase OafA/YrhL